MQCEHKFDARDIGDDTFILEHGISLKMQERPSVLIVPKHALRRGAKGWVMTISTGNHSVAAFPLLDGRFWKLSNLKREERSSVLMHSIICANIVNGKIEISQREIATADVVLADEWLREKVGFDLSDIVMIEREQTTLDYYRRLGQEWRIKPLAWTEAEMKCALSASQRRISSEFLYYHSAHGVHFLTLPEFRRLIGKAANGVEVFIKGLKELTGVYEQNRVSFTRMIKYRGHHEIELFGLRRGEALAQLVPELERLMEAIALGRVKMAEVVAKAGAIAELWESLLVRPELSDQNSKVFIETLYMNITGEVYATLGEGSTPAFDDRRTALPGATFVEGRLQLHPGADARSELLLSNLRSMLSRNEIIEYANIYELREEGGGPLGQGQTREVVYKTNLRPVEASLIEKGLSSRRKGYSDYMLARIGALRSLGIGLSTYYRLLRRRAMTSGRVREFYIRMRCEGEPLESIPTSYYRDAGGNGVENRETVLGIATLMGDAAAQNLVMKKFDPNTESPLFGVGKEIYEFEYDILREEVVPKKVTTCSIRGSFGWPNLDYTDENLKAIANFYFTHFAHALKDFQRQHTVEMSALAESFMSGFEFRIHTIEWQLSIMRDKFEAFKPKIVKFYDFDRKWRFVLWSLERHARRLPILRKIFFEKVKLIGE